MRKRHVPLFLCFGLVLASTAQAQLDGIDLPLEELVKVRVVSLPKFAENADAIPSVVSILKREEIRLYGWRTLGDALRTLQGFNVTSDHTYAYAGVRGVSPPGDYRPRLQLLIDGMPINENIYAGAPVDSAFPLDLGLVERIEVVRGPSASVYGGDAMFGVINVVTRSGQDVGGSEVSLAVGSERARQGRLTWGGNAGGHDVLLSVTGFGAGGQGMGLSDVSADGGTRRAQGVGAEHGGQLFAAVRGSDWRFTLTHSDRDRMVPTASFGTIFNDRSHREADRYSAVELSKEWRFAAKTSLHQRLYAGDYRYDGLFPYDHAPADPVVVNRDKARGNWWGVEHRLVSSAWAGHRTTLGVEYRADSRQDQLNDDLGYGCYGHGSGPCLDDRRSHRQYTLYAQDEIQLGAATLLTLGARYDALPGIDSFWSPRLGIVHDADEFGLFKLLVGSAFRPPSVFERYYTTPTFTFGNPAVKSERMQSVEVAWEKRFGYSSRLSTALYALHLQRLMTAETSGLAVNGPDVHAQGVEVEFERQWANRSQFRAGVSTQYAGQGAGAMDNSPRHMAKLNVAVPTGLFGVMAAVEGQWVSERRADQGTRKVGDYTLANLNFSRAVSGSPWDVSVGIYNLFDRAYRDPVAVDTQTAITRWSMPQLRRSVLFRTTYRF